MNIIRYFKDYVINGIAKLLTLFAFVTIGLIVISTFYTARYTFIKTNVNIPIYLTLHQGNIFKCDKIAKDINCFKTDLSEQDFFKNKQTIEKIESEANNILYSGLKEHIHNNCQGFYSQCNNEKVDEIIMDIFSSSVLSEIKHHSLKTVYLALKHSMQHKANTQYKCNFFYENKEPDTYKKVVNMCSIGRATYQLTGSMLLQNIYNNISFSKEGEDKRGFLEYFIKQSKITFGISNWPDFRFLTNVNSVKPDLAGIKDSFYGSFAIIIISLSFSIIIATLTALFLQEFYSHKRNVLRRFIIVNIDNMSAIPSVLCGLLGAVFYINILHLPRSSILVGAFTISFMTFPLIVISARNAIRSVPKDVKDLAFSMGASQYRVAFCHTLPMAINGIITGALLTIGKTAGETACLLIVGLTAFNTSIPKSLFDSTSTIATQVYTWMEMPDINFKYRIYAGMSLLILISFSISFVVRTAGYYKRKYKN